MSDGRFSQALPSGHMLIPTVADIEAVRRLQAERNAAAASKKGSKTFDQSSQRTDTSTKASLTESFDTFLYERDGAAKFSGYDTSIAVDGDDYRLSQHRPRR